MTIRTACSGMRVARWLESPEEKGGMFTDANGMPPRWPPRQICRRCAANRRVPHQRRRERRSGMGNARPLVRAHRPHDGGHTVTIAIFDHPGNPGYPTYWHARGYGLFAANPLGRHIFDPKQPRLTSRSRKASRQRSAIACDLHARRHAGRIEPRGRRVCHWEGLGRDSSRFLLTLFEDPRLQIIGVGIQGFNDTPKVPPKMPALDAPNERGRLFSPRR